MCKVPYTSSVPVCVFIDGHVYHIDHYCVCMYMWCIVFHTNRFVLNHCVILVYVMLFDFFTFSVMFLCYLCPIVSDFIWFGQCKWLNVIRVWDILIHAKYNQCGFIQAFRNLHFRHMAFIFMLVSLQLNMSIEIFPSSYELSCNNRQMAMHIHLLSVMFFFENDFHRLSCMQKHLVF